MLWRRSHFSSDVKSCVFRCGSLVCSSSTWLVKFITITSATLLRRAVDHKRVYIIPNRRRKVSTLFELQWRANIPSLCLVVQIERLFSAFQDPSWWYVCVKESIVKVLSKKMNSYGIQCVTKIQNRQWRLKRTPTVAMMVVDEGRKNGWRFRWFQCTLTDIESFRAVSTLAGTDQHSNARLCE